MSDRIWSTHVGPLPQTPPGYGGSGQSLGDVWTSVAAPTESDLEDRLRALSLFVYWVDARAHRLAVQRSVVVTTREPAELEAELDAVVATLGARSASIYGRARAYRYELVPVEALAAAGAQPPHDSVLVSVTRPLVAAKKSPSTGEVYRDLSMKYCPHSKSKLGFFVTTGPAGGHPAP